MAFLKPVITDRYALYHGDCCDVMPQLPSASAGLSIYSPPFCGLYHYSSSERDLSNCDNYAEFFKHYEFVVSEVHRLLMPGRISAVHCMDIPKAGANIAGFTDFPGDIIRLHERIGFEYTPRITIWKEPLGVRNRTMAKSLAHRQIVEDSTLTNAAAPDYLIPFRKKGTNPQPVTHEIGLMDYAGETSIPAELHKFRGWTGNQIENRYSHWIWRHYASSVWMDIRLDRVLPFKPAREEDDEKHVHPLQLDVIDRAVALWSNPDDVVQTPFLGVGSEAYCPVRWGRRAVGIELKAAYFKQAVRNVEEALREPAHTQDELFAK